MAMNVQIQKRLGSFQLHAAWRSQGVLGILGPSGCGKSKTLQCIAGIERPDDGYIEVGGHVFFDGQGKIDLPVQERRAGYLFQQYALFPNMTVEQNIFCAVRHGRTKRERQQRVRTMMARLQLDGLEQQKPGELSGGQQQRVALARILVNEPELLMLDEPFSALDSYLKRQVMEEMRTLLRQFPKDVILVTHNPAEAYELCSSLAVLNQGQVEVMGPTASVFAQPQTQAAARLTGCRNIAAAVKRGRRQVCVPAWGITLTVGQNVGDTVCAVGIRDHSFDDGIAENRCAVTILECVEQPFSWRICFRFCRQDSVSAPLFRQLAKGAGNPGENHFGVCPEDVLLLYR